MLVSRRSWPIVLLLSLTAAFTNDAKLASDIELGRRLGDIAAQALEATLTVKPEDPSAHAQLLGYYYDRAASFPQKRLAHVLWFIRHRPADPLTPAYGMISPLSDAPGYKEATDAWDKQVDGHPTDAAVLADAAVFFDNGTDTANAQDLLRRAVDAEPQVIRVARAVGRLARAPGRPPARPVGRPVPAGAGPARAGLQADARPDRPVPRADRRADGRLPGRRPDLGQADRVEPAGGRPTTSPTTPPMPTPSTAPTSSWARSRSTAGTWTGPRSSWPPPPR